MSKLTGRPFILHKIAILFGFLYQLSLELFHTITISQYVHFLTKNVHSAQNEVSRPVVKHFSALMSLLVPG